MTSPETQPDDFATKVAHMRHRQREYFRKPHKGALIRAKIAEKEVDELIDKIAGIQNLWQDDPEDVETDTHA